MKPGSHYIRAVTIFLLITATTVGFAQQKPARRPAPEKPAASGSDSPGAITGRVVAEGGHPVAGASVIAMPAAMTSNINASMSSILRPSITDEDGRFQLSGLARGAYTVYVMMPGYVIAQEGADSRLLRPGDNVTVSMVRGAVITGRVTGSQGEPVVGARVQAIRIKDTENRPVKPGFSTLSMLSSAISGLEWKTDDRGVYRIYGLEPGIYHVAAGGRGPIPYKTGPYDKDAMTYYPSGTADIAADVTLRAGDEAAGIDIRYRGTAGYSISGAISGAPDFLQGGVTVMLTHGPSGALLGTAFVVTGNQSRGFIFDGVGDGDYFVAAYANSVMREGELASATPRRVTVKGGDVTGANLSLLPLGIIKGHVVIERALGADLKQKCSEQPAPQLREVVVSARSGNRNRPERESLSLLDGFLTTSLNEAGEVLIRHTHAGQHFLNIDLPVGPLYVKAISLPGPTPGTAKIDASRNGINLKAGGRLDGLVITLAEGAASLAGKVVPAKEGSALPARMRVHLVPSERESAEETLRYAEAVTGNDASFEFFNLAPGRYWVVVRAVSEEESPEMAPRPLAWDASGRAGLRFEGEAINTGVELKPCSRLAAFTVRYSPPLTRPSKRESRD